MHSCMHGSKGRNLFERGMAVLLHNQLWCDWPEITHDSVG